MVINAGRDVAAPVDHLWTYLAASATLLDCKAEQLTVEHEICFPRLIVVPAYSQEVAGVRKEKERLTADSLDEFQR